jgi:hypothetical protein
MVLLLVVSGRIRSRVDMVLYQELCRVITVPHRKERPIITDNWMDNLQEVVTRLDGVLNETHSSNMTFLSDIEGFLWRRSYNVIGRCHS